MDSNFKVLTNVKRSNLRQPIIQNRFRHLTLNLPDELKPSTSTKLPQISPPKQHSNGKTIMIPTVPSDRISQPKNSEASLTNKLMLSSSSNTNHSSVIHNTTEANTNEEQTEFVNIETEMFTEPLQLSETEQDLPKRNVNNDDDLVTEMRNLEVSQRRISSDMFSLSTESSKSDFYLPPNRVISNKDESIDSISQRISTINMSDTRNDGLPDTQPNTSAQADTVPNTQQETVHSSSLLTSDDSDSSRPKSSQYVIRESAYLLNVASETKSPAKNLSTPKSRKSKSKNEPINDTLSNASPISLSSEDSEDNGNINDSVVTDDTDESDVIEILSSDDDEAEKDVSRIVSTLNTRGTEISETIVQKLNDFFDNIPVQTSVNSYEKNINLDKNNEINSNKTAASEINVSETNASNNDVIDLDESDECGNLVSEQVTSETEENNERVISNSSSTIVKNDASSSKPDNPQNDRNLQSQFSSPKITAKVNFSATININIHLSASSSDTESSSDCVNSSQQKDVTEKSKSTESSGSESSFEENTGEDRSRNIETDTHSTGSHESDISNEIESMPKMEFKNHQIDEIPNESLQSDASSVIESSQVFSAKKSFSSLLINEDSNSSRSIAGQKLTHESTNVYKDEPTVTSTKKAPEANSSSPKKQIDEDCDDDNRPEITEVGQQILNELYGDDWKTPQMVKKCQPVRSKYFTVIPKLNDTHDFSLFEREVASELESTRITPALSNEQIANKDMKKSQITLKPTSVKSTGRSGQVDSIKNELEDSSRILRSGRKVPAYRILDFGSDEDELSAKIIPDCYCHPDALRLRSNFKQYRSELTDRLVKIYNDEVFENMLGDIVVKWNKTLRKTAGICKYRRLSTNRTFTVELSEKVVTESDRLRDTLIHELCHAAAWVVDGDSGHGNSWKNWTEKAIKRLPELPAIKVCHNYSIDYKYTYKCSMCGLKSQAHSKSKKVQNIRCCNCHGAIEIYLNKKDKNGKVTLETPKEASGFAKYVKENYKLHKVPGSLHANIMKLLGSDFSKLTVQEKLKYK